MPANVASVFEGYPPAIRARLLDLRALILSTAAETGAGPLTETLKWGQPSYLTEATKSGTTVRIDRSAADENAVALYVNCRTDLVPRYRELYGDVLSFGGNRSMEFGLDQPPDKVLRHCIAMALTYHRDRRN